MTDEFDDYSEAERGETAVAESTPLMSRMQRDCSRMLFFDIETVPDPEQVKLLPPDELPPVRNPIHCGECEAVASGTEKDVKESLATICADADSLRSILGAERNGKNRAGVTTAIASELKRAENEQAEFNKRCSITPELCQICCLSWAVGGDIPQGLLCRNREEEAAALTEFWQMVERYSPLSGFNVLGFDLPVIMVRSAILGVEPTRQIELNKYGNRSVLDLFVVRYGNSSKPMGLKAACRLMGVQIPAGDVDGSQVMELMQSDPAKVLEYCNSDVKITRDYWWKLSGFFTF